MEMLVDTFEKTKEDISSIVFFYSFFTIDPIVNISSQPRNSNASKLFLIWNQKFIAQPGSVWKAVFGRISKGKCEVK